ncbi:hypothetical protein B0H13DRAFT_2339902 [Mycena leptocephala]|nr:hypothetical protein B0H13DRAFT_2339902 [Mycena leptocephala]
MSYSPLLQGDPGYERDSDSASPEPKSMTTDVYTTQDREARGALKYTIYACIAAVACTLVNISFLASLQPKSLTQLPILPISNAIKQAGVRGRLDGPSSYIGLEYVQRYMRMNKTSPPDAELKPITGWPDVALIIDSTRPQAVLSPRASQPHQFTSFGMITPADKSVRADGKGLSTVVQFRVRDFAMERCSLELALTPPGTAHAEHAHDPATTTRSQSQYHFRGYIDVWQLVASEWLDADTFSWNQRPQRGRLAATWDVDPIRSAVGMQKLKLESTVFDCTSGKIVTFEIACAKGREADCDVQWIQPRGEPEVAIWLVQRQSA